MKYSCVCVYTDTVSKSVHLCCVIGDKLGKCRKMKSTLIKNNKLGARFPWRLRGLSQKRERESSVWRDQLHVTVSVYGIQLLGLALLSIFQMRNPRL